MDEVLCEASFHMALAFSSGTPCPPGCRFDKKCGLKLSAEQMLGPTNACTESVILMMEKIH